MDKNTKPVLKRSAEGSAEGPSLALTLQRIYSQMDKLGDLPIFSTSINRVRRASSNPDSDAIEVAHEIMKDASLSAKLLRLGNSAYYNRGYGKISSISRAVVLLGFETVANLTLTMKLIESFQQNHPTIDMNNLLVKSFMAAGFARDVAAKSGIKDIETSYICTLLHNLGDITVANFLPHEYKEISRLQKELGLKKSEAQYRLLGATTAEIGQAVATRWEFPPSVTGSMSDTASEVKGPIRNIAEFNRTLSLLSNKVVGALYTPGADPGADITSLMQDLATAGGLDLDGVGNCLSGSFKRACELAEDYGLSKKILRPVIEETDDPSRDKWARQFSYFASTGSMTPAAGTYEAPGVSTAQKEGVLQEAVVQAFDDAMHSQASQQKRPVAGEPAARASGAADSNPQQGQAATRNPENANDAGAASPGRNLQVQLEYIREITALIAARARLNEVFFKVAEGIHHGAGFDRAVLCLLGATRSSYAARLAIGSNSAALKEYFACPLNAATDLFSKIMIEQTDLLVDNVDAGAWREFIARDFSTVNGASAFVVAPLIYDKRPLGFFYADRAVSNQQITADAFQDFLQFVAQARLALQICK